METRKNILIILLIFTATAVCYGTVLDAGFVWDDEFLVVQNPLLRAPLVSFQMFKQDIINSSFKYTVYYRPVQVLSYAMDYRMWGINARGFHFTNIFLHFLNSLLVLLLAWKLTGEKAAGLLAGVLFAIHPALSGAVSYVSGRTDLLFFFFGIIYMLFQIAYFERRRHGFLWAGIFFLILSLLSKEAAVIFPVLALLMYLLVFKKRSGPAGSSLIPGFALSIVYAALHRILLGSKYPEFSGIKDAAGYLLRYAEMARESLFIILFPAALHLRRSPALQSGQAFALLSVLMIFILVLAYLKEERPGLSFGLWCFLAGLVPFAFISGQFKVLGEHWVYLSSVGIFIFISIAVTRLYYRRGKVVKCFLIGLIFAFVSLYSSMTVMQNRYWQSDLALSGRVMDFSEADRSAVYYKAVALTKEGKKAESLRVMDEYIRASGSDHVAMYLKGRLAVSGGNVAVAEKEFARALSIKPEYDDGYLGLAMVRFTEGRDKEGIGCLEKVLQLNPDHTEALTLMGMAYVQSGDHQKALEIAAKARKRNPYNYDAVMNQGNTYLQVGDLRKSLECYMEASKLYPERPEPYYRIGYVFLAGGEQREAITWIRKSVMADPTFKPARDLLFKIRSKASAP